MDKAQPQQAAPAPGRLARACVGLALASASLTLADPLRSPAVAARHAVVASAHPLACQAGIEVLKSGGNAVDAAVATAFALGVVEPQASGIGGEGVMIAYLAESRTTVVIDFKSVAPASTPVSGRFPAAGPTSVAVPGVVAGLTMALERHGTKRLDEVLAAAIRYAEGGFIVTPTLAAAVTEQFEAIQEDPALAALLCPDGLPIEPGATLRNPDLGTTLRAIAAGGAAAFYHGEVGSAIGREVSGRGGYLTAGDLAAYRPEARRPVEGRYHGFRVLSAPPPVGGTAVIETLQILGRLSLKDRQPTSATTIHLVSEALKRASADFRAFVADPAQTSVPVEQLLARRYARRRAREISPERRSERIEPGLPVPDESPSTTSLAVVDARGNMVALTQTISDFFGAKVMVAGVILNNEMRNFSRGGANAAAPGKRVRTTIAPTVVLRRGRPFAVLGTPGGARITATTVLLLSNLVDHGMSIQEAIEAPRFFARETEKDLYVEDRVPAESLAELARLGYSFQVMKGFDLFFGGAQGIVIDRRTGLRHGGADPRRDGAVLGY